jgi:LPS-assembly protein
MSRSIFKKNGKHRDFPLKTAASLVCLAFVSSLSCAQGLHLPGDTVRLNQAKKLDEQAPTVNDETSTYLSAFRMDGTPDDRIKLYDDAEIRRGGVLLKGDTITYTFSSDEVYAQGNALVSRAGATFKGPELTYRLDAQTGSMPDVDFFYSPKRLRGNSESLEFLGEGKAKFCNAIFTTCQAGDNSWWIAAKDVELDQNDETADASNARLYLGGVPVFATPWLSLPVTDKRKSGFLTPKFGVSSSLGVNMTLPYYWNIAPNYDYTITPQPMTKRGVLLGNEFRYLQPNFGGQLNYDILWKDREYDRKRYALAWKHYWRHSSGLSFGVNYQRVSDDDYISDFSTNLRQSSETVLPQNVWLSFGREYWNTSLTVSKNQTLHSDDYYFDKPYEKVPEYRLNGYVADYYGFVLSSNLSVTRFVKGLSGVKEVRKPSGEGVRSMVNSSISYPLQGPYWFLTPKATYSLTRYDLDAGTYNKQRLDSTSYRALPILSLDSGLVFERDTTLLGAAAEQTFEPRLFYAYIPYRNQSRMPNFDSSSVDMNFAQLFTPNIYTGWDRIGEANQLSATVTSRYLSANTGEEWINATVGERYYFRDQRVHIGIGNDTPTKMRRDLLASTQISLIKNWKAEAGAQYSTQYSKLVKGSVGVRYTPKQHSQVGLFYRYNYDEDVTSDSYIRQLDFNFQWPVTQNLYLLGRYNYSFRDKKGIESILGVEYQAGCWTLRTAVQQYITSSTKKTTSFFIELELLGFGSFGVSPIEALKDNITGYQPLGPRPVEVGRYDYYE